jgi:hypothetical protein
MLGMLIAAGCMAGIGMLLICIPPMPMPPIAIPPIIMPQPQPE